MNNTTKLEINPSCPYTMPTNKIETHEFTEFCNFKLGVSPSKILADIERWLEEDHGSGDPTLFSALAKNKPVQFFIVAKQDFTLACKPVMEQVFRHVLAWRVSLMRFRPVLWRFFGRGRALSLRSVNILLPHRSEGNETCLS